MSSIPLFAPLSIRQSKSTVSTISIFAAALIVSFGSVLFSDFKSAAAQGASCVANSLVITELMIEPTNTSSPEWIEVFNPTGAAVSLEGFKVIDNPDFPSEPIGVVSIPAGGSAILFDSENGSTVSSFTAEWGPPGSVELVPLDFAVGVFGFVLDNSGDTVMIEDGSGTVCAQATYGDLGNVTGGSAYLVSKYNDLNGSQTTDPVIQDDSIADNWRLSSDCQGTSVFTSFTASTTSDIGSPNGSVPSSCYPTITASNPFEGETDVLVDPAQLGEMLVTFSEPIGIQDVINNNDDVEPVTLICGGVNIDISINLVLPIVPADGVTEIGITALAPLTNGANATQCTLAFNQGFLSDTASHPNTPTGIPGDLTVTFTTEGATLVELASFLARSSANGTLLTWTTSVEIDNAGFNLYRSNSSVGPWQQVNSMLIPAQGSPFEAASYTLTDDSDGNFYMLEDIDVKGKVTRHGPFALLGTINSSGRGGSTVVFLPLFR